MNCIRVHFYAIQGISFEPPSTPPTVCGNILLEARGRASSIISPRHFPTLVSYILFNPDKESVRAKEYWRVRVGHALFVLLCRKTRLDANLRMLAEESRFRVKVWYNIFNRHVHCGTVYSVSGVLDIGTTGRILNSEEQDSSWRDLEFMYRVRLNGSR